MSPACMQEIGDDNKAPPEWLGEIEPTFLSYEAVPILKVPFFNEVPFNYNAMCTASVPSTGKLQLGLVPKAVVHVESMHG